VIHLDDLPERLQHAVDRFWGTRGSQGDRQGAESGRRDAGNRTKVTGGKHLDGFVELLAALVQENCPRATVFTQAHARDTATVLPGYFRPTKYWDLLVLFEGQLIGCVELKSHAGPSFGNNYNNRSEEAIGTAADFRTAYREGAFAPSPPPWVGFLMLLEDTERSTSPVAVEERHFPVFPEFKDASYARRYEVGITRLVREGYYSAACLLLSSASQDEATWREPNTELSFRRLIASLIGHTLAASAG